MDRSVKMTALLFRTALAVLCVAVLSPVRDAPGTTTASLLSLLAGVEGQPALVISKSRYTLSLYKGSTHIKTYAAVFGKGYADGDKMRVGDRRTPEGEFFICSMNTSKRFHRFIGLSYPGVRHAAEGYQRGLITREEYSGIYWAIAERRQPSWETKLGGAIGIHGRTAEDLSVFDERQNWTDGCVALSNAAVDELFTIVSVGTPVTILP